MSCCARTVYIATTPGRLRLFLENHHAILRMLAVPTVSHPKQPSTTAEVRFRLRIRQDDSIAIGPGKVALLEAIQLHGSISAAARSLGMSYRRAWVLIDELNQALASPATASEQGGQRGGGSALTPVGNEIIRLYRSIEREAYRACAADIGTLTSLLKTS